MNYVMYFCVHTVIESIGIQDAQSFRILINKTKHLNNNNNILI